MCKPIINSKHTSSIKKPDESLKDHHSARKNDSLSNPVLNIVKF